MSQAIRQVEKTRTQDFCDTVLAQLSASRMPSRPSPSPAPSHSLIENRIAQLERLAKLKEQGVLTEAEFLAEKLQIMGATSGPPQKPQPKKRPSDPAAKASLPTTQVPLSGGEADISAAGTEQAWEPTHSHNAAAQADYGEEPLGYFTEEGVEDGYATVEGPFPDASPGPKYKYGKIAAILLVLLAAMFVAVVSNPDRSNDIGNPGVIDKLKAQAGTGGNTVKKDVETALPTSTPIPAARP